VASGGIDRQPFEPSLAAIYLQGYSKLLRSISGRLRCPETAQDIAQEAFSRLLASASRTTIQNPVGYLYRVAEQLVIDCRRSGDRGSRQAVEDSVWEALPLPAPGPEDIAHFRLSLRRLGEVVSTLPPACRRVFVLCKLNGHSHDEVAAMLGISRSAVEKHVMHAALELRRELVDLLAEEPD
jgi:RNA polymerase sigma factor (sigma-70 family)